MALGNKKRDWRTFSPEQRERRRTVIDRLLAAAHAKVCDVEMPIQNRFSGRRYAQRVLWAMSETELNAPNMLNDTVSLWLYAATNKAKRDRQRLKSEAAGAK